MVETHLPLMVTEAPIVIVPPACGPATGPPQASPLGGGADDRVAEPVPGDSGPLRQEGQELPGADPTDLFVVLV
jgi:hypothetical protein